MEEWWVERKVDRAERGGEDWQVMAVDKSKEDGGG